MGSFNIAATCSNLSLGSDEDVLFFPLIKTSKYKNLNVGVVLPHTSFLVSNEAACILYKPFCLPIRGKYSDYGSIEDIVEDENTKYIESFFDMSILDFVNSIQERDFSHKDPQKLKILESLSGMWENTAFYKNMVNTYNKKFNSAEKSEVSYRNLKHLNFSFDKTKNTGDSRYNIYTYHPFYPDFYGHSDGTWTHFFHKNKKLDSVYDIKSLFKLIKSEGLDFKGMKNISDFDNLSIHELTFKLLVEDNLKNENENKLNQYTEILKILEIKKDSMTTEQYENIKSKVLETMENFSEFNSIEQGSYLKFYKTLNYAINKDLYKQLADLLSFTDVMHSCNKIFMPTQNGEQEGNHKLHLEMTKETLKILNYKLGIGNF